MNMPAMNLQQAKSNQHALMGQFSTVANIRWQSAFQVMDNSEAVMKMLDERFPLDHGSHADVKEYVVYFRHIMAYFADGTHCGLAQPKQFVALCGHIESPDSIVLRENDLHVEIKFDRKGNRGCEQNAGIQDVQIEFPTCREFTAPDGEEYTI
jgi:malate synthase